MKKSLIKNTNTERFLNYYNNVNQWESGAELLPVSELGVLNTENL